MANHRYVVHLTLWSVNSSFLRGGSTGVLLHDMKRRLAMRVDDERDMPSCSSSDEEGADACDDIDQTDEFAVTYTKLWYIPLLVQGGLRCG